MSSAGVEPIREAIGRGDYDRALELWNEYAAALVAGGLSEAALAEVAELLAWSRPVAICARAHAQERLRVLNAARAYAAQSAPGSPTVRASF